MCRTSSLPILVLVACALGCTHTMEVKNLDDYRAVFTEGPPQNLAVLPFRGDPEAMAYFQLALEGLKALPSVSQVRTNWRWDRPDPGFRPDAIVELEPKVEYRGSWWNFPITFPGFLLFTHAWNGYVYRAHLETEYAIHDPASRKVVRRGTIPTEYSMRHCDFERGFWASIGWWTPS